jgi:hypothetical protein
MYSDKIKRIGEHNSVAEELMSDIPDLEFKCRIVEKTTKNNTLTLEEALKAYNVTEIQFISYLLLSKNQTAQDIDKKTLLFDTIKAVVSVFLPSTKTFDHSALEAYNNIREISNRESSNDLFLTK